jgi:hypothetical protein
MTYIRWLISLAYSFLEEVATHFANGGENTPQSIFQKKRDDKGRPETRRRESWKGNEETLAAYVTWEKGGAAGQTVVPECSRYSVAAVCSPKQVFKKSDAKGGISKESPPFCFW